ncbi:hypothetical protein TNCV_3639181 [Trichonephila clavipes]|nr:hypothetical protein TNCV_3639181 [Trichonephila clavipes]
MKFDMFTHLLLVTFSPSWSNGETENISPLAKSGLGPQARSYTGWRDRLVCSQCGHFIFSCGIVLQFTSGPEFRTILLLAVDEPTGKRV